MPAQSFKALGAGNGFPYCLEKRVSDTSIYNLDSSNDVPLEDAMKLCWNIKSLSFGPASLNVLTSQIDGKAALVNFEPKDLASDPIKNCGSTFALNTVSAQGNIQRIDEDFHITISKASMLTVGGVRKYFHGISFFYQMQSGDLDGRFLSANVSYSSIPNFSASHFASLNFSNVQTIEIGESGSEGTVSHGNFKVTTQSVVTIGGFKFLKTVVKESEQTLVTPATATIGTIPITSEVPSIDSFFTYE